MSRSTSGSLPSSVSRSVAGQHSVSRHGRPGRALVAIERPHSAHTMRTTGQWSPPTQPSTRNTSSAFRPINVHRRHTAAWGGPTESERGRPDKLAHEHPPTGPDHRWAEARATRLQPAGALRVCAGRAPGAAGRKTWNSFQGVVLLICLGYVVVRGGGVWAWMRHGGRSRRIRQVERPPHIWLKKGGKVVLLVVGNPPGHCGRVRRRNGMGGGREVGCVGGNDLAAAGVVWMRREAVRCRTDRHLCGLLQGGLKHPCRPLHTGGRRRRRGRVEGLGPRL